MFLIRCLVVVFCFLSNSCTTVPVRPEQQSANALMFRPEAGRAAIYVYRQQDTGNAYPVYLDGDLLGSIGPKTFLVANVSPGPRVVSAEISQEMVSANAGGVYFVRAGVTANAAKITSMRLVSSEEGKQAVRECKQAASNR
jgi:hypothetical protein